MLPLSDEQVKTSSVTNETIYFNAVTKFRIEKLPQTGLWIIWI